MKAPEEALGGYSLEEVIARWIREGLRAGTLVFLDLRRQCAGGIRCGACKQAAA